MSDIKKMIEVMQAFADGKVIEAKCQYLDTGWFVVHDPLWEWHSHDYRVAEKQDGVVYVVLGSGGEDEERLRNTLLYASDSDSMAVFAKRTDAEKLRDEMTSLFPHIGYTVLAVKVIE